MKASRVRFVTSTVMAVSGLALLAGCGEPVTQVDAKQFPEAVAVYELGCNTCHGENLQGGIGPSLQHVGSALTLDQIVHQVEVGGGPMPAYAAQGDAILTTQQILAVAKWLASKK